MDKSGLIYFVDGTMIRRIDQNGVISTLLGSNDLTSARPLSCDSVMDISQVRRKRRLLEPWARTRVRGGHPASPPAAHLCCTRLLSTALVQHGGHADEGGTQGSGPGLWEFTVGVTSAWQRPALGTVKKSSRGGLEGNRASHRVGLNPSPPEFTAT